MNQLHLPDKTSKGLALGLARGPSFLQMKFWLDTCLELVAPVPTRRAQGLDLGLPRGLRFPPEEELALLSLAYLPLSGSKWSNFARLSAIVL